MNEARINMLKQYLQDEPTEPFYPYALALEYQQTNPEKARELFDLLLAQHPDYLPTYYMAGNFFQQQHPDKAVRIFHQGLRLANRMNDLTAARELRAALDNLED